MSRTARLEGTVALDPSFGQKRSGFWVRAILRVSAPDDGLRRNEMFPPKHSTNGFPLGRVTRIEDDRYVADESARQ